jgi:hypothetical protein
MFDLHASDDARRQALYAGNLSVFPPKSSALALCDLASQMIEEAFADLDPQFAQYYMPVEQFVAVLSRLKPRFIHHPETKQLIRNILEEFGCDLEQTYFDVPRLRGVTHGGYLTSGVGYVHHPHRDTWYSAPMCQLNWWIPIYDFTPESGMAFHPNYWNCPIKNGSDKFNYYDWNADGRKHAASHIASDTRKQPKPEENVVLQPDIRLVCPAGGTILFSAAQLHSTVPNTSGHTRFSIDFRTVHYQDIVRMSGPANIDSRCTGTSIRDFMRASDLQRFSEDVVKLYDSEDCSGACLLFVPQ